MFRIQPKLGYGHHLAGRTRGEVLDNNLVITDRPSASERMAVLLMHL